MSTWDAGLYLQFVEERTQPVFDLVGRLKLPAPRRIIDIGCGPGNSTAVLRQRWPDADITGLDYSPEMLAAARASDSQTKWVLADAATWVADEPFDLVFSNATLQWLPNHQALLPHLLAQVAPGGALGVQMPAHYVSPLHHHTQAVSADPAWSDRMELAWQALTNHSPGFYYDLLQPLTTRLDLWETEYIHILNGPEAILDWLRGTGLRPYLAALDSDVERQRFEALLLTRYEEAYPRQRDGRVLFPFRRLFLIATL